MNTPQQLQDLVADTVHAYPSAQVELDPLPSGVCFLWVTLNGRNFAMEYHPVQGVGVSENTPKTIPFTGHDTVFPTIEAAVTFYKQLLASAALSPDDGPFSRTAFSSKVSLKSS